MTNIIKTLLVLLVFGVMTSGLFSCNKFLEVQPEDRFLSADVFNDEISANNALNGIYINLAKPDLYGGEMTMNTIDVMAQYYFSTTRLRETLAYNYRGNESVRNVFSSIWRSSYIAILNANSFLAQLPKSGVLADDRRKLLMGEAYALRAFVHFDLLRLFGPVYPTNPDQQAIPYLTAATEKIQPILPAKSVLDSVLVDLNRAEQLLQNDPVRSQGVVPVTGTDPKGDFVKLRNRRLNYYAVLGIKARVLLYKGDKPAALLAAKQVIEEAGKWFPWTDQKLTLPGIADPDRSFSSEVIFGVQNPDLYNQQRTLFAAALTTEGILAPSSGVLSEVFENNENDYRLRVNWVSGAGSGKPYKTFVKYQDVSNNALLFRNLQPLLRISEMYYIAAECSPDRTLAFRYLNTVRTNRGLPSLPDNVDISGALQRAYRKEFWGEGQTFFYYKRKALASISGYNQGPVQMNASKYVVPLPDLETQNR
ncbi:RagB/SusD family nutrient uptake outer membrane protein [Pedobacter endophyticus]|uniref:RagB/SusD family nutrient uptake outer membrane protein n=1 Tax=Pedobacter endophyticus TaxID=2789740 RepID=A0A7S9Q0Z1_9SPHI|nr:RagB/SusD family nutrient uptake outer membrane protein [Pedobacter endophyticus]QPH41480.1 RagB/SusD family nutrient uptake outer membrane protein [Pedobacter endophyticus]